MGVKNHIRLALLFVCLMVVGIALYPYVPRLVKIAQAVQGELKFGSTMDQVMTVINKTYYSADVFFGNGAGGTVGVWKGVGNVGIGTITPQNRLDVWGNITARTTGAAPGNPIMQTGFLGNAGGYLDILADNVTRIHLSSWTGAGNSYIYPLGGGNLGIGTTAPTKTLDVVGDINFSGTLYQGGVAYQGSQWTTSSPNIYYNTGSVGIGISSPQTKLDINDGSLRAAGWSHYTTTRSLGPNAGDWIEIGRIAANGKFTKTNITIVEHNTNNLYIQEYEAYGASHSTPDGASWVALPPKGGRSWYALQNVAVDVTKDGTAWEQPARLRLRRISSAAPSGAGSVTVYIDTMSTFTELSSSGTGATVLNGFFGEAGWMFPVTDAPFKASTEGLFVQQSGNVGIGTTNPQKKLDIVAANSTINNTSGNLSIVPSANLLITQGNVGIGSANPGTKLDVTGTTRITNTEADLWLTSTGGGAGTWRILGSTGTTTKLFRIYDNDNNVDRLDITASGNVGISSTTPGAKLDVGGVTSTIANVSGNISIVPASNLVVTQGNVGIGSTSPGYKLDVNGALSVTGATRIVYGSTPTAISSLLVRNTSAADTGGYSAALKFSVEGGGDWAKGGVIFERTGAYGIGKLHLATRNATDTSDLLLTDAKLTVDSAGNVGIGTTAPGQKLSVAGVIESTSGGVKFPDGTTQTTAATSGKVLNVTIRNNCTRVVLGSAPHILETFAVNKLSATSTLLVHGAVAGFGDYSGSISNGWKYGTATEVLSQSNTYAASSSLYGRIFPSDAVISGYTTTGSQNMVFRFFAQNGSTTDKPFQVYNPSTADDARLGQTCSVYTVWEIGP